MYPPLVRHTDHLRSTVRSMRAHPRLAAAAVRTMKGVWRCDAVLGGRKDTRLLVCRHWTVHNGNRRRPSRIDVHCLRCGTRHQHVPNPRDRRGRRSRMRYVEFPHDVGIEILVNDCARRNRNGEQLSNEGFQTADKLISGTFDSEPESEIPSSSCSRQPGSQAQPHNVNEYPPLIVRVWRWIVTFLR